MKRFLVAFFMLMSFVCMSNAQTYRYRANSFAIARVYNGNYTWGEWQRSSMLIDINYDSDIITIYSEYTQYYKVLQTGNAYYDNDGGSNVRFYVVDGDNDRGYIRLRIQRDGTSQLYVDFNDVAWVYGGLVRIN